MPDGFSLIKINGKIVEPATELIRKISAAIGGGFKPRQIRRVAEAEADAEVIKAKAQIEITGLRQRALTRFIMEESKKQDNIESITEKAIGQLNASSTPQDIEDDWITNFFDKCRIISDEDMQILWAKILAGEANSPGIYSKRTVNILGTMNKSEALLFTNICSFMWLIEEPTLLIYDSHASIYNDQNIKFSTLKHLEEMGLINYEIAATFVRTEMNQQFYISYHGTAFRVDFKNPANNTLETGEVLFTNVGQELANICNSKPITGFADYVIKIFSQKGVDLIRL